MGGPTAGVVGFSDTFVTPLLRRWKLVLALGIAMIVLGVLLLVNLPGAAFTLALLVALSLLLEGFDELMQAERHEVRWPSYVLGVVWIVTGIIAVAWPDITLWALAAVTGVGFLIGGVSMAVFAARYRRELPSAWVWLAAGVATVVIGVLCLVWPDATIVALAVLLGVHVLLRGVVTTAFALGLRRLSRMAPPAVPT